MSEYAALADADVSVAVLCYNEMVLTAKALGLRAEPVERFASSAEGALACAKLRDKIDRRRALKMSRKKGKPPPHRKPFTKKILSNKKRPRR